MIDIDPILDWALLLLPVFFWGAYIYYKDRHKPEPVMVLILATVLGYGSAYIGLFFYGLLARVGLNYDAFGLAESSQFHLFLYSILAIGPIEELAKFLPFIIVLTRLPHFDEHIDGIVYAAFIGLGFSLHENQQYLQFLSGNEAVARAIVSPIVHALFASIWGYAFCLQIV
jgi:RsiW-degrading membrane proteinase PrsW (M82 family)